MMVKPAKTHSEHIDINVRHCSMDDYLRALWLPVPVTQKTPSPSARCVWRWRRWKDVEGEADGVVGEYTRDALVMVANNKAA